MTIRETNFASPQENLLCKKQKYVRGMKRNQIIQRWLQGIEDPDYEVFPTKKDSKYIVKPKQFRIEESVGQTELCPLHESIDDSTIKTASDQPQSDPDDPVDPEPTPKSNIQRPINKSPMPSLITRQSRPPVQRSNYDSTINLEILEQLRNLGEELRNDRFKKEQKQYIKQVVNKELTKSRIRSKYVPDTLINNDPIDHPRSTEPKDTADSEQIDSTLIQPEQEREPVCRADLAKQERPVFRSRIRR